MYEGRTKDVPRLPIDHKNEEASPHLFNQLGARKSVINAEGSGNHDQAQP
jgi:hypothetical protein